eukprot:1153767-Pleurochrysis_carterae.AAC.2
MHGSPQMRVDLARFLYLRTCPALSSTGVYDDRLLAHDIPAQVQACCKTLADKAKAESCATAFSRFSEPAPAQSPLVT